MQIYDLYSLHQNITSVNPNLELVSYSNSPCSRIPASNIGSGLFPSSHHSPLLPFSSLANDLAQHTVPKADNIALTSTCSLHTHSTWIGDINTAIAISQDPRQTLLVNMSSLRAERHEWQRAIQGMSANEALPSRVFPEYIYVNLDDFMRASDPFWEPDRPTTSSLYKACVSTQGRIFCTRRMQRWLHSLPDRPEVCSEPLSPPEPRHEPPSVPQPSGNIRPRAQSAPTPPGPATPELGTDLSPSHSHFRHPNPLSQHPVQLDPNSLQLQRVSSQLDTPLQLEEVHSRLEDSPTLGQAHLRFEDPLHLEKVLPKLEEVHPQLEVLPRLEGCHFQPKVPQRRSSLYFNSQPASHAHQSHHPLNQFEDLFQGLEQPRIGESETSGSEKSQEQGEACDNESVTSRPKFEANMGILTRTRPASKRHTIHFGSNLERMQEQSPPGNSEKNGRAQVSCDPSHQVKRLESCETSNHNTVKHRALRLLLKSWRSAPRAFSAQFESDGQPWALLRVTRIMAERVLLRLC